MKKIIYLFVLLSFFSCKRDVADAVTGEWKAYSVSGNKVDDLSNRQARELYSNYKLKISKEGVNYLVVEDGGPLQLNATKENETMLKSMSEHHCTLDEESNSLVATSGTGTITFVYSPSEDEITANLSGQSFVFKRN